MGRGFRKKFLSMVVSLALLINMGYYVNPLSAQAVEGSANLVKSVDNPNPYTGDEFTYTIKYANPSTSEAGKNVKITDVIPDNIEYVSSIPSTDVWNTTLTKDGDRVTEVVFELGDATNKELAAGRTGVIKITARFPAGVTTAQKSDGTDNVAVNTATMTADNFPQPIVSNAVTVTPKVKTPDFDIKKVLVPDLNTGIKPVIDQPVTYKIMISGNSASGGLNLTNVSVVDELPKGAEYISSSDSGSYNGSSEAVTWNIDTLTVGQNIVRTVRVKYPASSFDQSSTVTNKTKITATPYGSEAPLEKSASVTHGFGAPSPGIGGFDKYSRQLYDYYSVGQTANFWLGGISNTGNIALDKIEIIDEIPAEIALTKISTGKYSDPVLVDIFYQIDNQKDADEKIVWNQWSAAPYANPDNISLKATLPDGASKITKVKWVLTGEIIPGFSATKDIQVFGTVSMPSTGNVITNMADLTATYHDGEEEKTLQAHAQKDIYVIGEQAWLVAEKKTENSQVKFNQKDIVPYELTIKNHEFATGNYDNPIAVDVLPNEVELNGAELLDISGSNVTGYTCVLSNGQNITPTAVSTDIDVNDHRVVRWEFAGTSLAPGEFITIKYKVKIPDSALQGTISNDLYVTNSAGDNFENSPGSLVSIPTLPDKQGIKTTSRIIVNFTGSVEAHKYVNGALDKDESGKPIWTTFTTIGQNFGKTLPGGIADYRLTVKNSGANGPIKNLVLVDIFPYVGDKEVLNSPVRGSAWSPYLVNDIKVVSFKDKDGTDKALPTPTILYSTTATPSLAGLSDPIGKGGVADSGWQTTAPADITSVKAIKIYFPNTVIDPGDEIVLGWPMRASVNTPAGKIAWNSFAYGATYPDIDPTNPDITIQEPFLPSEPIKVGFQVQADPSSTYNLGNYVWEDMNKDGIQNDGEKGINGVLVNLYSKDDLSTPIAYTRTGTDYKDKAGYYNFPNLPEGYYVVEFVYPKEYKVTLSGQGSNTGVDSDINPSQSPAPYNDGTEKYAVKTGVIFLNDNNDTVDLGLYKLASVGDYVWNDKNADGIQNDGADAKIGGVTVKLFNEDGVTPAKYGDGNAVPDKVTGTDGKYLFAGLEPGKYKIQFVNPSGMYKFSPQETGTDQAAINNNGSDADASGYSKIFSLQSGQNRTDIDAGMYLAQISGYVWHDRNANGVQDDGIDAKVSNVKVELTDENGSTVKNAYGVDIGAKNTDSNGKYVFDDLKPGNYTVRFTLPSGASGYAKFSPQGQGTDGTKDSDVGPTTGIADIIGLEAGTRNLKIDAGVYNLAQIGDQVWDDKNANGIQDAGEIGVAGVEVILLNGLGEPVSQDGNGQNIVSVLTDTNGKYLFADLIPGSYKVRFKLPDGSKYVYSLSGQGSDRSKDSDAVVSGAAFLAETGAYLLSSGDQNLTVDAGIHKAVLGDLVWEDKNANGKQDSGEPGIAGVKVELLNGSGAPVEIGGTPLSTFTDANGKYEFDGLDGGDYRVRFTLPTGYHFTVKGAGGVDGTANNDVNPDEETSLQTGTTDVITLIDGQVDYSWDAGLYRYASVGDHVWLDKNGNNLQDDGEPGLSGIKVDIYTGTDISGVPLQTQTTGAEGNYKFENLIPGTYRIVFTPPADYYKAVAPDQGDDGKDSDIDSGDRTVTVTLLSNETNLTVDAGFVYDTGIALEKTVSFGHNEGLLEGVSSLKGQLNQQITYKFVVKNTGETYLKNIQVTDSILGASTGNGQILKQTAAAEPLAPGESFTYYYQTTLQNSLHNTAQVTADPCDQEGTLLSDANPVSTQDTADVIKVNPQISIEKTVYAGAYQQGMTGTDKVEGQKDYPVTYLFTVKNTGDTDLKNIEINDAILGIDQSKMTLVSGTLSESGTLAPGLQLVYCYSTKINGSIDNVAVATATPCENDGTALPNVSKPQAQDTAQVIEIIPEIEVSKTVYKGHDGGALAGTASQVVAGKKDSPVTYVFTVKNVGERYLTDIQINDSNLHIDKADMHYKSGNRDILGPGESLIYYYETSLKGDMVNTVTANGTPSDNTGTHLPNIVTLPEATSSATVWLGGSLGSLVWNDANGNGSVDQGEKGISGVVVILKDSTQTEVARMTTGADGKYLFDDLVPGNYTVTVLHSSVPSGMVQTYEKDSARDEKVDVFLNSGEAIADVNFGYYVPPVPEIKKITGVITHNGIPVPGATVVVRGSNNFETTVTADANGAYTVTVPGPGEYTVTTRQETGVGPVDFMQTVTVSYGSSGGGTTTVTPSVKTITGVIGLEDLAGGRTSLPPMLVDRVTVKLKNPDGGYFGTGEAGYPLNTQGVFRMPEVPVSGGNYEMEIWYEIDPNNPVEALRSIILQTVQVRIESDGQLNIIDELVDPYGTIKDSKSGSPVDGADVTLYYADTPRNAGKGLTPGAEVKLPEIPGFLPNDNRNPQISVDGKYGYMVYPYTDYYIVVKKSGYEDYKSEVISVENEIVRHDISLNPIEKNPGTPDPGTNPGSPDPGTNPDNPGSGTDTNHPDPGTNPDKPTPGNPTIPDSENNPGIKPDSAGKADADKEKDRLDVLPQTGGWTWGGTTITGIAMLVGGIPLLWKRRKNK